MMVPSQDHHFFNLSTDLALGHGNGEIKSCSRSIHWLDPIIAAEKEKLKSTAHVNNNGTMVNVPSTDHQQEIDLTLALQSANKKHAVSVVDIENSSSVVSSSQEKEEKQRGIVVSTSQDQTGRHQERIDYQCLQVTNPDFKTKIAGIRKKLDKQGITFGDLVSFCGALSFPHPAATEKLEGTNLGEAHTLKTCLIDPAKVHTTDSADCRCMVKPLNSYAVPDVEQRLISESAGTSSRPTKKRKQTEDKQTVKKRKIKTVKKEEKKKVTYEGPETPPELPEAFIRTIQQLGGKNLTRVIQKPLYESDTNPGEGRLAMSKRVVKETGSLNSEEEKDLEEKSHHKPNDGMKRVELIDTKLRSTEITLKQWNMMKKNGTNNAVYVLSTEWNKLVKNNDLKIGNIVQVWSFRVDGQLKLALVLVDPISIDDPDYDDKCARAKAKAG